MNSFDRFEDDDLSSNTTPSTPPPLIVERGIKVWKIVVVFLFTLLGIIITSIIICGTNATCRGHVPTIQNMLNDRLTSPFITTAINIMQLIHILLSLAVFYMTYTKALHWATLQILMASLFHITLLFTLFLASFLGWDKNWANVGSLIVWMLWMLLVMKCLKKYYKYKQRERTLMVNWVFLLFFVIATLIYIIFRALSSNTLDFKGKDTAVFVAEVIGALSGVGFITLTVYHIKSVTFIMQ